MSVDRIPMSKPGYEKLKAQLDAMKNEKMPMIAEQIAAARDFGDLSENAEFDAAVEAQGMLQAQIDDLQDKLARAMIVDKSTLPTDRVVFGSKVRVLDLGLKEEEDFILVGPGERYTVVVHADNVGTWAWHCHILSHAESDKGMVGMVTAMIVKP